MGKILWCLLSLGAAFVWFSCAAGFLQPTGLIVTGAFVFLGINCILEAMKTLVGE